MSDSFARQIQICISELGDARYRGNTVNIWYYPQKRKVPGIGRFSASKRVQAYDTQWDMPCVYRWRRSAGREKFKIKRV